MALSAATQERLARLFRAIAERLPMPALKRIAPALYRVRPLGAYPGWQFAIEERHPTPLLLARKCLWDLYRERGITEPVRVPWYTGLELDLVLGNDQSRCLYVGGSFEPNEFAFLSRILEPGGVFIDIGANEGFYAVFAARRVQPAGRVVAFEPSPRELQRLRHNIEINALANVTVDTRALGRTRGKAVLHIADAEHNGQNTLGGFGHSGVHAIAHVEVELIDLDSLIGELGIAHVEAIKMDVEGAELEVLHGAARTLDQFKPVLLLELFDEALRKQGASADAVLQFLDSRGYRFYTFDAATGVPVAATDLQHLSQNVVAVHRERAA